MNTKQRLKNIELESPVDFPLDCWIQEKVDGSNMGVSWTSGPVLRNRKHILKNRKMVGRRSFYIDEKMYKMWKIRDHPYFIYVWIVFHAN